MKPILWCNQLKQIIKFLFGYCGEVMGKFYKSVNFGGTMYIWDKEVTVHQKVKLNKACKEVKTVINYMIWDENQCLTPIDVELVIPLNP